MSYDVRESIEHSILKVYPYGSVVYGTESEKSDIDYIAVVDSKENLYYNVSTEYADYTVYSESEFINQIKNHHISVMECIFQSEDDPYVKHFELDYAKLRRAISSVASNSFGKCGKKLKQGDYYIGKKSLFHSLRILDYGIQIATYGKILDYGFSNHIHRAIFKMESNDWKEVKSRFQYIYNERKTAFKLVAPLDKELEEKI